MRHQRLYITAELGEDGAPAANTLANVVHNEVSAASRSPDASAGTELEAYGSPFARGACEGSGKSGVHSLWQQRLFYGRAWEDGTSVAKIPANTVQRVARAASGSNDASAITELEVDGTPVLGVLFNDLKEAAGKAHGSNTSTTDELGEHGAPVARR